MRLPAVLLAAFAVLSAPAASIGSPSSPSGVAGMGRGVFDTGCRFSHTLRDDPLVHPNMPGMSHVHDFFGNRTTTGRSTGRGLVNATLANAKNTTCEDKRDGAAYWAPALYQDEVKLRPEKVHVYYRHQGTTPAKPFPVGFGMITDKHFWWCGPGTMKHRDDTVPACPSGRLFVILTFPSCWDGRRLFAQNGSHVAFRMKRQCDAAHSVRIPELTVFLSYRVDGKPHAYTLSSGHPRTAHADFFNAWEPKHLARLVEKCLNRGRVASCRDEKTR